MAIPKQFQLNTTKGGIHVHFYLDDKTDPPIVHTIQIHSNYGSGLPLHPEFEFDDKDQRWKFAVYSTQDSHGKQSVRIREWIDDDLTRDIITRILEIKEGRGD